MKWILLVFSLLGLSAEAAIYKCTNDLGKVTFSMQNCGENTEIVRLKDRTNGVSLGADGIILKDHIGSLYSEFSWAGHIRDPYRTIEIMMPETYTLPSQAVIDALGIHLSKHDMILQIGGMGSAKLPAIGTEKDVFSSYMDFIIKHGASAWQDLVTNLVNQVESKAPVGRELYWQIGNEINSNSYRVSIDTYFQNHPVNTQIGSQHIPVYVEYFLAPTLEAMRDVSAKAALGSVSGYGNSAPTKFMDNLLNYTIQGVFAPTLAGLTVKDVIDLITIHYHLGADDWWDDLTYLSGYGIPIWTTEDIGIRAAQEGKGAGAAISYTARALQWALHDPDYRWSFYGTTNGTAGSRIDDALTDLHSIVSDQPVKLLTHRVDDTEEYVYRVGQEAFITLTPSDRDNAVTVNGVSSRVSNKLKNVKGWVYQQNSTTEITPTIKDGFITFQSKVLSEKESILLWVTP